MWLYCVHYVFTIHTHSITLHKKNWNDCEENEANKPKSRRKEWFVKWRRLHRNSRHSYSNFMRAIERMFSKKSAKRIRLNISISVRWQTDVRTHFPLYFTHAPKYFRTQRNQATRSKKSNVKNEKNRIYIYKKNRIYIYIKWINEISTRNRANEGKEQK